MPYYFQVQTTKQVAVPEGCGTEAWHYDDCTIETDKEIIDAIYEYKSGKLSKKKIKELADYEKENILENAGWEKCYYDYEKQYDNSFFTAKACELHIKANKHNYNEPHSYLQHAYRNPEMELVLRFLCGLTPNGKFHR